MIIENAIYEVGQTLFVFALEAEATISAFDYLPKLITGIGKINATFEVARSLSQNKPSLIVNLGSAGSNSFPKGTIVCCNKFVQRDMDVRGLGYELYETPLSGINPVLEYGLKYNDLPLAVCGSGDSFEMSHNETIYNVVDMEAYALALVAYKEQIPFLCLKYISDGADDNAADDWNVQVHKTAEAFASILNL